MPAGPVARQLLSNNLVAMLRRSKAAGGLGYLVGDNQAPRFASDATQPDPRVDYPYGILYDIDGGDRAGDYADPVIDAQFAYQLSVWGRRRDQAQLAADVACTVLVGRANGAYVSTLTDPAGLSVIRRSLDPPAGVIPQATAEQRIFMVPVRFRLDVTAA